MAVAVFKAESTQAASLLPLNLASAFTSFTSPYRMYQMRYGVIMHQEGQTVNKRKIILKKILYCIRALVAVPIFYLALQVFFYIVKFSTPTFF